MSNRLLLAAVLPSVILIVYIYRKDRVEKEPLGLLVSLFLLGGLTTVSASAIEIVLGRLLIRLLDPYSTLFIAVENFLIIGLAEEGGKYFVLKKRTWRSPHFNFTFDAVVYSVVTSLGFATVENVLYVWTGGMDTAIARAIFSIPGHAIFGVFMGCWYGMARLYAGDPARRAACLRRALWIPVLVHGAYDFCLSMSDDIYTVVFLVFEVVVTVIALRTVRRLSREDMLIM